MRFDGFDWHIKTWPNGKKYWTRTQNNRQRNPETILLHRYKMEKRLGRKLKRGEIVDHFDGDTLNNEDENLRILTHHENIMNQKSRGKVNGRGVCFEKSSGKYRVRICINYKRIHVGRFNTLEEANKAYKKKAKEVYKGIANENLFST